MPRPGDYVRLKCGNALYRVLSVGRSPQGVIVEFVGPVGTSYTRLASELVIVDPERAAGQFPDAAGPKPVGSVDPDALVDNAAEAAALAVSKLVAAKADAVRIKKERAEAAAKAAGIQKVLARVDYELALARATIDLLRKVSNAVIGQPYIDPDETLATHRKALNPLAKTYGYHLVLVGDNKQAVLSKL